MVAMHTSLLSRAGAARGARSDAVVFRLFRERAANKLRGELERLAQLQEQAALAALELVLRGDLGRGLERDQPALLARQAGSQGREPLVQAVREELSGDLRQELVEGLALHVASAELRHPAREA